MDEKKTSQNESGHAYDKSYALRSLVLFSAFIIILMYIETMLVPSLPAIAKEFHVTPAAVSLVLAMYLVSGIALSPVMGKLGDIYGKKRVLKYILPIYMVSVAVTGFSPSFDFLIVARLIQGVGFTIMPLAMTLVREQFPREKIPQAQGLLSAMFGVGGAIGLPIGAFISNNYGWQVTYHTALPFVVVLTILLLVYLRESKYTRPNVKMEYINAAALAIGLGSVVFAVSEGSALGWASPTIIGLFALAIIMFVLFALMEKRANKTGEALLNFKMLRNRNVMGPNLIVLIVGFGFFLAYQVYAYEFELPSPIGYGFNIFHTGLALVPFAIMSIIIAPIVAKLLTRHGAKPYLFAGSLVVILGFLLSEFSTSPIWLIAGAAIVGAGMAALNVALINILILSVENKEMGVATSTNVVFRILGSSLGAPVAGVLITEIASKTAFNAVFYLAIASFVVVISLSFLVHEVLGNRKKVIDPIL
ncbi:MAG: MFS transporter [Candidatus Micrarchaeota archaeon]|nr:MFS transporter [Candidatus Micrarchaeota archaeon]MDE1848376.1 MFS transporter [Candidatus Micrarchaeota archaeon]MDE1864980.1 MFS transporter [Candidatus Micrarchaeota archaeon]